MYSPHINPSDCRIPTAFYLSNFALEFHFLHVHTQIHSPFSNMTIKVSYSRSQIFCIFYIPFINQFIIKFILLYIWLSTLRCSYTYHPYHFFSKDKAHAHYYFTPFLYLNKTLTQLFLDQYRVSKKFCLISY